MVLLEPSLASSRLPVRPALAPASWLALGSMRRQRASPLLGCGWQQLPAHTPCGRPRAEVHGGLRVAFRLLPRGGPPILPLPVLRRPRLILPHRRGYSTARHPHWEALQSLDYIQLGGAPRPLRPGRLRRRGCLARGARPLLSG